MGQTCCQDVYDHNLLVEMGDKTNLYDFQPSEWPNEPKLLKLIQNSCVAVGDRKTKPYKHKYFERYYWGSWSNQIPKGKGIYYFNDNEKHLYYEGQIDGEPNGQGHVIFNFGQWQYEGTLRNGQAHGQGRIKNNKQGYRFQGQWRNSKPYIGTLILKSKNKKNEKSETKEEEKATSGVTEIDIRADNHDSVIRYPDGRVYTGEIDKKRFLPHGKGRVIRSDKTEYIGEWFQGQMHGLGKFQWSDGSYYDGDYMFGKKHGYGKFKYNNGKVYKGMWSDGKQHGQGILYSQDGQVLKNGKWENGKFLDDK